MTFEERLAQLDERLAQLEARLAQLKVSDGDAEQERKPFRLFYTVKEAATVLRIHEDTLRRQISRGLVPTLRQGGRVLVKRAWVDGKREPTLEVRRRW